MPADYQHVLLAQNDAVLTVTMNRPEVLNALNERMLDELGEIFEQAAQDSAMRCIIFTGAGRAFGAGQDVRVFATPSAAPATFLIRDGLAKYHRVIQAIRTAPKPVMAALRGVVAGASANLALACDFRIAADDVRFIEAFARIGLVPDAGGAYFLPRLVGLGQALELAMLADEVSGPEAARIGLVNRCVPAAEFASVTEAFAQRLAQGPTTTYGLIKDLTYRSLDMDLTTALQIEGDYQERALATADHREGVMAFVEKRPAHFTGH